jgi:uncharacterized membrane protein YphA (DoxX/SURF4 family)
MNETALQVLQWYGAITGVVAAAIVALDIGRRPTGWAFVLFCTSSVALIAWGFFKGDSEAIGWQNVLLLAINLTGVYRYMFRKTAPQ